MVPTTEIEEKEKRYIDMIEDILTLNEIYQEKKVDLNSVDRLGQSVLHFAAKLGFAQVCDFLLKLNVDD